MASTLDYIPREYYGARLEPFDTVLHGAGQSQEAFVAYSDLMPAAAKPLVYMTYVGTRSKSPAEWVAKLKQNLDALPFEAWPQIGLSMTRDGTPEEHYEQEVAFGELDKPLHELFAALETLKRPVFIRTGYEFNGPWNGYMPETFKLAYQRIARIMREDHPNLPAANVWCVEPGGKENYMDFYPGDEWVDWWSIDFFSVDHFDKATTSSFMAGARKHRKPVMIGESTPRRVGVLDGKKSWNKWFSRYFGMIRQSPGIKCLCYINWEWSKYEMWKDWGDARIEANPEVTELYRKEMALPLYQHAGTRS